MKKLLISIAALVFAATLTSGQQLQQLPNDPATRVGKLDNGLTYYIRHNELPAKRAEFWLCTDAGAIQEELPNQDGLAHFLEHMCFNGTKNFPGKGILNYLESIGASFGGNVNASTGIEQTIYLLNNIPLVNDSVVDSCILIMHDYSHFVLCEADEIDAERGVIIEEKRTRNTAQWRNQEKYFDILFAGTKYADGMRMLIGSEENLRNFTPEDLTSFYHKWYTPNNQALIVVGDIDIDEVEAKIQKIFADIPAVENPAQKEEIIIPDNQEPIVGIITDPETTSNSFDVLWKSAERPRMLNNTAVGLMTDLLEDIASIVMVERIQAIAADPSSPLLRGQFSISNLINGVDAVEVLSVGKEGKDLEAFEVILTEAERMRRYGFTDDEVERAKAEILSQYERRANQAPTRKNSDLVNPMINNFYKNYAFMDPAMELQVVQAILPQLQTAIVNQAVQSVITRENMSVIYTGREGEGVAVPAENAIKDIIVKVQNAEIAAPAGEEVPSAFLDPATLKGSKVKSSKAGLYGSTELTLANGVKVVLLPKDIEKDRIQIDIVKKGGRTLIEDADLYSFDENIWSLYISNSGIGQFSNTMVSKMLSGKQVSASPYISSNVHGISGSSTRKDIETAFQMMYLLFTDPRFDADEYNQGITQIKTILPNLLNNPDYVMQEKMYPAVYNNNRRFFISDEVIENASLETLERVYRSLFADAAGATVLVAGDFEVEPMTELVCKYFGSLPKGKKAGNWIDRKDGIRTDSALTEFTTKMQAPKVSVLQVYNHEAPYTAEAKVAFAGLSYILDMVYVATLREEEGGTYGASASATVSDDPYSSRYLLVAFDTNEAQADGLRELAAKGLRDLAEQGPTEEHYDKTVKYLEKILPENHLKLSYWMSALKNNTIYAYDYDAEYAAALKSITPEKIQAAAAEMIGGNKIELIMRPEK